MSVAELLQAKISPTGNRTPVSRVTGGDTYHYTIEDWQMQAVYRASGFSSAPMKWTKTVFGLEVVILVMCECDIYKHQLIRSDICENCSGPTEIRTRIAGFKVQSANHYTIGPDVLKTRLKEGYTPNALRTWMKSHELGFSSIRFSSETLCI